MKNKDTQSFNQEELLEKFKKLNLEKNDIQQKLLQSSERISNQNNQVRFLMGEVAREKMNSEKMDHLIKILTKAEHQALNSQQHRNRAKFFESEYKRLKKFH
ncbi:MAG: hypothetical protein GY823_05495 [Flavobacteriaceae bacterium]|nr:hypothetical protein [Flavobacteriaceae bacterium]